MPLVRRDSGGPIIPHRGVNDRRSAINRGGATGEKKSTLSTVVPHNISSHDGVRQSLQTNHLTTSTGSIDLDRLLVHGGLPLGSILLLEENGSTDFASIILRSYASQGVVHSRLGNSAATNILVIGPSEYWGRELPGLYKDKKEIAQEKIDKTKGIMDHLADNSTGSSRPSNMKIAWRYEANARPTSTSTKITGDLGKPNFIHTFDLTTRLTPAAANIKYVSGPLANFTATLSAIESSCLEALNSGSLLRVVIPGLLHPAVYSPGINAQVVIFMHKLQQMSRKYSQTVTVVLSLSLNLYPRNIALTRWIELLSDGVIELEPKPDFFDKMKGSVPSGKSEASGHSSDASKPYQGFVNIYKLPVLSERGAMVRRKGEFVFRAGRRNFEICEWGIPVEDAEDDQPKSLDY